MKTTSLSETVVSEAEEKRYAELQLMALDFARHGETANLELMVRSGLPVNLEDSKGNSLLMLASYHGQLETTSMLLRAGAEVDRRNHRHQTPLGGAAFKGYFEVVEKLLEAGADLNADNGNGMTPLMFATLFGRTEVAQLLRSRGAQSGSKNRFSAKCLALLAPLLKWVMAQKKGKSPGGTGS